jgi:hypothetical protein
VDEDDPSNITFERAFITAASEEQAGNLGARALGPVPRGFSWDDIAIDIDEGIRAVDVQPDEQYNVIALPRN